MADTLTDAAANTETPRDVAQCVCCLGMRSVDYLPGLRRCPSCSHVWADLRLSPDELRALYSRAYFEGDEYVDYERQRPGLRRNFQARLAELGRRHPKGGRLWEIGCAYGFFLKEAAGQFDASGCDISEHAVAYARDRMGVDAHCVDYVEYEPEAAFDAVCLWDCIEHLQNPEQYVFKAAKDLRPNGTIAILTGDIGSRWARLRGRRWRLLHPPTHLHYFTVDSIRTLLIRAGFVDFEFLHVPLWRYADAVAYAMLGRSGRVAPIGTVPEAQRCVARLVLAHCAFSISLASPSAPFSSFICSSSVSCVPPTAKAFAWPLPELRL